MATIPPFHGTLELRTVNGVTDYVQVGPGGVALPNDGLAPGPGLWPPNAGATQPEVRTAMSGPLYNNG